MATAKSSSFFSYLDLSFRPQPFLHSYPVKILYSLSHKFTIYLYILSGVTALRLLVLDLVPSFSRDEFYKICDLSEKNDEFV